MSLNESIVEDAAVSGFGYLDTAEVPSICSFRHRGTAISPLSFRGSPKRDCIMHHSPGENPVL